MSSLQLSAEPQHRSAVRLRPRRLPFRPLGSSRGLLCPEAPACGIFRRTSPATYLQPSISPLPPRRSAPLGEQPRVSFRSLQGTRKGTVALHLVSLRWGHPRPSALAGTKFHFGSPRDLIVKNSQSRAPRDPWSRKPPHQVKTPSANSKSGLRFKLGLRPPDPCQAPPLPGCLSDGGGVPRWRRGCRRLCLKL